MEIGRDLERERRCVRRRIMGSTVVQEQRWVYRDGINPLTRVTPSA